MRVPRQAVVYSSNVIGNAAVAARAIGAPNAVYGGFFCQTAGAAGATVEILDGTTVIHTITNPVAGQMYAVPRVRAKSQFSVTTTGVPSPAVTLFIRDGFGG